MDFDFDMDVEMLVPIGLALLGAFIAFFTASGGFSSMVTGEHFNPGIVTKVISAIGGGVIGWVWGYLMTR